MKKTALLVLLFIFGLHSYSQNTDHLISSWKLEKISYKNIFSLNDGKQEEFFNVLKAGLYNQLDSKQRLDFYELEQVNELADELLKRYYQSEITFQSNRAFYNRSKLLDQPTSGEYLLERKKIFMEWETGDKNYFKILKITSNKLVLKDKKFGIVFNFSRI